jgi:serine/threonine-protein kinase
MAEAPESPANAPSSSAKGDATTIADPFHIPPFFDRSEQSDPFIGKIVDERYRIESKIGVGGMGAVYRVTRLLIGDTVAIKILHATQNADSMATERFRREAQAAARLKHPNVVAVYDFGVSSDGFQYLVMELVEGNSLREIIRKQGPFNSYAASEIVGQVCAALDAAHQQGVIHRDIKPDNILVSSTADGRRVKVLDFGIAKLRDQSASDLTQTGSVMGTPHYMSPEQCLGEELDSRSDVYSLGIVLYEMLCGVVPFNSPISTAVVVQHVNQPPPSLRARNPNIPPAVEAVVFHALAKRREARPQTAGDLAREFEAAVSGSPSGQRAVPIDQTLPLGQYQTPGYVPTMVMPSGPHFSAPQPITSPPANQPGSSARTVVLIVVAAILLLGVGGGAWLLLGNSGDETSNVANTNGRQNDSSGSNSRHRNQNAYAQNDNDVILTPTPMPTYTPTPSYTPMPTPMPVNTNAARGEIASIMNQWANTLTNRNLSDHLRLYADRLDTFYQYPNVGKDKVRDSRQSSFSKFNSYVSVQVSDVSITFDSSGTTATVTFDNTYDWRGDKKYLNGKSRNEMVLSRINGAWLITSERHLSSYFENRN